METHKEKEDRLFLERVKEIGVQATLAEAVIWQVIWESLSEPEKNTIKALYG